MHHIVADVEGTQVVDGQLFALLHAAPDADPVEAVENLVVGITADLVRQIDESVVDVLAGNKLRQQAAFLGKDGPDTFQLGFLFAVNLDPEAVFNPGTDVLCQQFKVFVEHRLGGDVEGDSLVPVLGQGCICIYFFIRFQLPHQRRILVHVGRIQPDEGAFRQDGGNGIRCGVPVRNDAGNNIHFFIRVAGQLGVAVEAVDFLYLVTPERNAVRIIVREGENIHDGSADGELPRSGHEVHFFKALPDQAVHQVLVPDLVADFQCNGTLFDASPLGNTLQQRVRIGYHHAQSLFVSYDFLNGRRALDTQ